MADVVDLDEFLEEGWTFHVRGRDFTVPEVEWPEYLSLAQLQHRIEAAASAEGGGDAIEGDQWFELAPRVLGPVLDELIAAKVKGPTITMLARSAYFFQLGDRAAADALLVTVGKAPTPTLETESGSTSTTPTGSTSTESETATKRPASTTATRSPTTSSGRSRATKDATPTGVPATV